MPDEKVFECEKLLDDGSLVIEHEFRLAKQRMTNKIEMLRSKATQYRDAADRIDAEADRLVDEGNEDPFQHKDEEGHE